MTICRRGHVLDQRQERQLATGRQRRLRLVEEVQPARHEPLGEEAQEALAVALGIEPLAVPLAERRELLAVRGQREDRA